MEGIETNEYRLRANKAVKDDGGPAFPAPEAAKARFGDSNPDAFIGMSLRDYFAAKALQGMIANGDCVSRMTERTGLESAEVTSLAAYEVADAMLAERAK